MRFDNLKDWLAWQESLNPKEIDLGLERSAGVLKQMGHVLAFDCPLITVAGTNGKGSIVAILEAIAVSAGLNVCSYTSPHIFDYNERIKINRQPVEDALICEAFERIDHARCQLAGDEHQLTYFEFGTLAAIDLFFRTKPDLVILEVGLGGRLDAVNIMEPDVSILSSVAIDHVDWLGDDREKIGYEKAGIFRAGKTAICGDVQPPQSVIKRARDLGCDLLQREKDYRVIEAERAGISNSDDGWRLESPFSELMNLPPPSLIGPFQKDNAATAIVALQSLQQRGLLDKLPADHGLFRRILASALPDIQLAGRFQKIHDVPAVYVDVAHNPHAALGLLSQLKISAQASNFMGKTWAVVAMLADKDIARVISNVATEIDHWCFAGLDAETSGITRGLPVTDMLANLPPEILPDGLTTDTVILDALRQELMDDLGHESQSNPCKMLSDTVSLAQTVEQACVQVLSLAGKDDRIIIFGSFYTVNEAMSYFSVMEKFGLKHS
ncbi:MAG: bifunctional folylpolyglutamate synthase/dihydrofolate synthase [Proteobacteria bacterium]|nr:bifunctional folylpolyglutamate synthase/dihydrofolate synthase [Pseudomonadota bacterium]